MKNFVIAIHGGAGTITKNQLTAEMEMQYREGLEKALNAGYALLGAGKSALDAVQAAVASLEDNPLFNAGRGAVFTKEGTHEMDAAIMSGKDLSAGAVTCLRNVKNPVSLARAVMEKSGHVFLAYPGAEKFARQQNLPFESDEYFFDSFRYDQWVEIRDSDSVQLDHTEKPDDKTEKPDDKKFGTVGAVALDQEGNLAAATSTGGLTNKNFNRIGDTPVIGAGTYANNNTCAISCTGVGEFFIRMVVAYDVSCLMEYKSLSLEEAGDLVVNDKLVKIGGEGGLIGIDKAGNVSMPFNSEGMYRASRRANEAPFVAIYKE